MENSLEINTIKEKIEIFLKEATRIFLQDFKKDITYKTKENFRDLVTDTDIKIEKLFIDWLHNYFPSHVLVGEEILNKTQIQFSDWCWYLDPIDGTTSFIHQISDSAIILSVTYKNVPQLCWILFPVNNEVFFAEKGKGAFRNGEQIKIKEARDISTSLVYAVTTSNFSKFSALYSNIWDKVRGIRMPGSMAICFSSMCLNYNQISILEKTYIWEYSAGCLLVQEAGGYFTNIKGEPVSFGNHREDLILAASKELISEVVKYLDSNKIFV